MGASAPAVAADRAPHRDRSALVPVAPDAPPRANRAGVPSRAASSPHAAAPSCQIIVRAPEDARVGMVRQRERQARALEEIAGAARGVRVKGTVTTSGGCLAFTRELRRVAWPAKFRPELPSRYDGTTDPLEFLHLYAVGIEAAGGDQRVLANWLPMALKDSARSWLMNLPEESISSWRELTQ